MHPGAELYVGGPTLLSYALSMGNTVIADHLYQIGLHPDGLKVIDAQGTFEDYSDVDFTFEYGSCLISIMTSPHLSLLEKIEMMKYALSNGANPNGHSPQASCFDTPIQVAASIHVCLVEFFLSLEMDIHYSKDELIFYAVSSNASFDQKQKILELFIDEYDTDINRVSERSGYSPIEWAILKNGTDAIETVRYLIERGAVYDVNILMQLAQDYQHYDLRDTLFHELYGSEGLYLELLSQELEIKMKANDKGGSRIVIVYPEKGY
jgi:ankyrin repeat protein